MLKSLGAVVTAAALASAPFHFGVAASDKPSAVELPSDAAAAWKVVTAAGAPPLEPAEWNQKTPSEDEVKAFRTKKAESAGRGADVAKAFLEKFPSDEHAGEARAMRKEMLQAAAQLGDKARLAELRRESGAPAQAAQPDESDPFVKRMMEAKAAVEKLQDKGFPAMLAEYDTRLHAIIKEFPEHPEPYYVLLQVAQNSSPDRARALAKEILDSKIPEEVKAEAKALVAKFDRVGKPVDIKFKAVGGKEVDLAAMHGKVVLVDFWATWCGPCRAGVPEVVATYKKWHDKGFEIVGISLDQEQDALDAYTKKNGMEWPQYFDGQGWQNKIARQFGVNSIPAMWLIDKTGALRDIEAREDLGGKVEKLLAENAAANR